MTSARATSAIMAPPLTGGTSASITPGFSQTVTTLVPIGTAEEVQSPTRVVEKDSANDKDAVTDMDMHIDWDIDVDLGLDMDLDPVSEEKPLISTSPQAVQRPAKSTAPVPRRALISAQSLRPTALARNVSPALSLGSVTAQRKEATPPAPIQPVGQLPLAPEPAPEPAPQTPEIQQDLSSVALDAEQNVTQDQPAAEAPLVLATSTELLPEAAPPIIAPSQPAETAIPTKPSTPPAEIVQEAAVDTTSTKATASAPPLTRVSPAPTEDRPVRASTPATAVTNIPRIPSPEKPQDEESETPRDEARDVERQEMTTNALPKVGSSITGAADQAVDLSSDAMVIDSPEMQPDPLPEPLQEPLQVDPMAEEQEVTIAPPPLPAGSPPPMPPPTASLPPPSAPVEVLPSPPSHSPPPLPVSSPVREIPPPVSHTPPPSEPDLMVIPNPAEAAGRAPAKDHVPIPDDSLPVVPPTPAGRGKLQVEVVIDEAEFENSTDGYFRRFCADIHPHDLHPNNTLAAYGFTKFFAEHLLNKRCVITSTIAKDDIKQLVVDSGGSHVHLTQTNVEFDIMLVSNDLYPSVAEAQADLGFTSGNREIWSFGPADELDPPQWRLKRRVPKRSGLVSFCATAIIKSPDVFLECLRKIDALPNWSAFLSAATIRALHHYIKHASTPQTLRIKMFRTMNDATGLFKVRYPRNTDGNIDRKLYEKQQQVVRKIDRANRWIDLQHEVMKDPELMTTGNLCAHIPAEKMPPGERKYWERDSEILAELQEHQSKLDEIYAVKRSIFAGFDYSNIRKGLGDEAIAELGFEEVEGYRMDDLLRDLSRDIKFAGLLMPSERMPMGNGDA